jgi:hypothetical protein
VGEGAETNFDLLNGISRNSCNGRVARELDPERFSNGIETEIF